LKTTADVWRRQPCGTDRRNSNEIPVAHSIVTCHVPPVQEGTGTDMAMAFQRAVKREAKLRLAISGPAGSGKTYTALTLARTLAGPSGLVAVIDTERGSASKYADLFNFDVLELDSFHPDRYVEAISAAVAAGYAVVVIDSLSHGWTGHDGMLAQVDRIAKLRHNGNTFKAWGDNDVRRMETAFIESLTGSPVHIIATMRSKTEYAVEQNERGKAQPRKVGTAPVQRDGLEYEFDVFGMLSPENELMIQKTRCPALTGQVIARPGKPLADTLIEWLGGAPALAPTAPRTLHAVPEVQPMTPAQPAPKPAAKGKTLPHWKTLERRANYVNISSPTGWEELCRTLTGKKDGQTYTMEDYDIVERDIQEREAEAQAQHELGGGETTGTAPYFTDDPGAPIGTSSTVDADDLSTVGVGKHPRN